MYFVQFQNEKNLLKYHKPVVLKFGKVKDTFDCLERGCNWHLVVKGQDAAKHPMIQDNLPLQRIIQLKILVVWRL